MSNVIYSIKIGGLMSIKKITFPYYQIKNGETLKIISKKFDIDSIKILLDNNISPKNLKEGDFLILKK